VSFVKTGVEVTGFRLIGLCKPQIHIDFEARVAEVPCDCLFCVNSVCDCCGDLSFVVFINTEDLRGKRKLLENGGRVVDVRYLTALNRIC
jgi:hypothetical protein